VKADNDSPGLTERQAYIVLNAIPDIGPVVLNRLLAEFGGDTLRVLAADPSHLRRAPGIRAAACESIRGWRRHFDVVAEEGKLSGIGADFIALGDSGYPEALRQIPDPPLGIYRQGAYAFDRPGIAIVGTRRATLYGRTVARTLASECARSGFCVVSGLALGIDTAAHEGALAAGGRTVAVLGTGLDVAYPPENRELQRRIAESGAVLSESPFGRPPTRWSFPLRNRVVSGLSDGVVVVESGFDGGAMITARMACEQGRPVFAVPGRIDQPGSTGCHRLIRDGVTLLTGIDDILEELSYLGGRRPPPVAARPGGSVAERSGLNGDEGSVLGAFRGGEILGTDGIGSLTGLPVPRVASALVMLELKGLVFRQLDGRYEAG